MPKVTKIGKRAATIRKFRSRAPDRKLLRAADSFTRHPATLLILGFILTAVVGSWIQSREQDIEKQRKIINASQSAIVEIQKVVSEWVVRVRLAHRDTYGGSEDDRARAEEAYVRVLSTLISQEPIVLQPFTRQAAHSSAMNRLKAYITRAERKFEQPNSLLNEGELDQLEREVPDCVRYFFAPYLIALNEDGLDDLGRSKLARSIKQDGVPVLVEGGDHCPLLGKLNNK
ncbi:hypothetical protein [Caballeronia sp. GAWG1-5s-s]|uniref:hypothetical protein n=1 Tax=Caballeronia sp. GAWG1-5s-s TaxID=2921743 RepID=UPI00202835F0|nr:hypothetical protein [Caballeronia sp. GAWG1-5s-s]